MRNIYLFLLLYVSIITLFLSACTLDKEPAVPTDVTNEEDPVFAMSEIIPDTLGGFLARSRLSAPGNLIILQHGWVWGEQANPTLQDHKLELGKLTTDSFEAKITGLILGQSYHFRPYVTTGAGTTYGGDECSFLGVGFDINTDTEVFQGANVQFTNNTTGNYNWLWDFGDGSTSTKPSPAHTFNSVGAYNVRLTTSNGGCMVSKEIVLSVIPDPFQDYWAEVEGGTFLMGCTAEQELYCNTTEEIPVHQVTLNTFFIGKTEITQGQWEAVTSSRPSVWYLCGDDCPVELVDWFRVVDEFIPALYKKTGKIYRLPTEAEWEFAARGGNNSMGYILAGGDDPDAVAWHSGNSEKTKPVGEKTPNEIGLYDMSGNVFEWCQDWYGPYPVEAQTNPPGPDTGSLRIVRGGAYSFGAVDARVSFRNAFRPDSRIFYVGFRLAKDK